MHLTGFSGLRSLPTFINVSGKSFKTIHAMDFTFFKEVNLA
jgi:hypothetical protein